MGNVTEVSIYFVFVLSLNTVKAKTKKNLLFNKHGAFKVSVLYLLLNKRVAVFYQVSLI